MKYFVIFDKNVAAIFQLQWNIGNIPDIFLQYSVLCGEYIQNKNSNNRIAKVVKAWTVVGQVSRKFKGPGFKYHRIINIY